MKSSSELLLLVLALSFLILFKISTYIGHQSLLQVRYPVRWFRLQRLIGGLQCFGGVVGRFQARLLLGD
jgi:hypothetical protein